MTLFLPILSCEIVVGVLAPLFPSFTEDQGDQYAQSVETEHREGDDALSDHVRSRCDNGRYDKDGENGVLEFFYHPLCGDQAHPGEEKDQSRKLEHEGDAQKHAEGQTEVVVYSYHRLEIRSHIEEEAAGKGEDNEVSENSSSRKENGSEQYERNHIFFFFLVKAWGHKHPELDKDERRHKKNRGQKGDLDVEHEGCGEFGEGELCSFGEVFCNRYSKDVVQLFVEEPGGDDTYEKGDKGIEESLP
jgi:hypothetical protein